MKVQRALAVPAVLWLWFFVFFPTGWVFLVSFARRGTYGGIEWQWSLDNYARLASPVFAQIGGLSLALAAGTAVICVGLALLVSWTMAVSSHAERWLLWVMLPFLTNGLIRVLGLKLFLSADGPVQYLLLRLGIPFDPYALTAHPLLVFYGMVSTYLPFAVLPLYAAFERFDFHLIEAAADLGAGPWTTFRLVIVPQLQRALWGAYLMVFIPCLGEYLIPDLLGGAKVMLLGNLITEQFLKARDWPFGAAVGVVMILSFFAAAGTVRWARGGRP